MKENVQHSNGKVHSISDALDLLNSAAENSADEIRGMISHDYRKLKSILDDVKPEIRSAYKGLRRAAVDTVDATRERATEMTVTAAKVVDKSAHQNAWKFIGGATLVSVLFGFLMGRKTRST